MTAGTMSILVMADGRLRTVTFRLPSFTLIGATTDQGLLPPAFISRFDNREQLDFYSPAELTEVIVRSEQRGDLEIARDVAQELAEVSRESPREALRLLRKIGDEAVATDRTCIDMATMARTLDRLEIDGRGLGPIDRAYLDLLRSRGKRPLGLARAAEILGICPTTLERVYEPYLLRLGLVTTTPAGRVAC
jgi:Holliday junction DNA helicase RuvB